ncbi:25903_t:CDS:2, partial [Racocetra persica]
MDDNVSYQFAPVRQRRDDRQNMQQPKQSRMCGIGEKGKPPHLFFIFLESGYQIWWKFRYHLRYIKHFLHIVCLPSSMIATKEIENCYPLGIHVLYQTTT